MECIHDAAEYNVSVDDRSLQGSSSSSHSESKESLKNDMKNEKLDVNANLALPADCLATVSMPRNWSQVERLKQQRLLLHQQLFAQKLNVKNDENCSDMLVGNTLNEDESGNLMKQVSKSDFTNVDSFQNLKIEQGFTCQTLCNGNNDDNGETDSSDSNDFIPRLHIAESYTLLDNEERDSSKSQESKGFHTDILIDKDLQAVKKIEVMDLDREESYLEHVKFEHNIDENESNQNSLDNSDLCDISASKINESLYNTISSVSENKVQMEFRIKEVLNGLKSQAEVKENEQAYFGYKIEKPLQSGSKIPYSLSCVSNMNCSAFKHFPDSLIEVGKHSSNIINLSPTQYVGLPVDVKCASKQESTCTERNDNLSSMKQKEATISESRNKNGTTAEHANEPDYRNIALEKMLALNRLGKIETEAQTDIKNKSVAIDINESNYQNREKLKLKRNGAPSIGKQGSSKNLEVSTVHSLPKKNKLSQEQKDLCDLKREVLNKRMQTKKLDSCEIKKKLLNAEQKLFEAKKEALQAELKVSEHKLKMAKQGLLFPRSRFYQRYCFSKGVATDDSTDTDEELIESEGKKSIPTHGSESAAEPKNEISLEKSELPDKKRNSYEKENVAFQNKSSATTSVVDSELYKTADQMSHQTKPDCTDESVLKKSENNQLNKHEISLKKQPDYSFQNCADSEKNKANDVKNELKEQVFKESRLSSKLNCKGSCSKFCLTAKTKTCASNYSKKCSPGQAERIGKDLVKESLSASVKPSSSQPKDTSLPIFNTDSCIIKSDKIQLHSPTVCVTSPAKEIPQSTIIQNALKTHTSVNFGMHIQSKNAHQSRHTERLILPSGFVKDESSNLVFHTYNFNGQTFAMIDNKLYQIHLKCTNGKTKTVIGALIPTTSAKSPANLKPKLVVTEFTKSVTTVNNKKTTSSTNDIPISTNMNVQVSQRPITYRFPLNSLPSVTPSLKLLIAPTNPNQTATHSTQVIRQPLMHSFGSCNNVRAHLQQALGHKAYITNPKAVNTQEFERNNMRLQVMQTHKGGLQYGNHTFPLASVPQNEKTQEETPLESKSVRPALPCANHQVISPRTAKSLLTNKTYVIDDTSPDKKSHFSIQSKRKIEYCGSVGISSASNSATTAFALKKNPTCSDKRVTISISKCGEPKEASNLSTVFSTKENDSGHGLDDLVLDSSKNKTSQIEITRKVNEAIVVDTGKEICQQDVTSHRNAICIGRSKSPSKVCSSMDSFINTAKRKRKATPLKKFFNENSSLPTKIQKIDENLNGLQSVQKDMCQMNEKDSNDNDLTDNKACHGKKTEPVPFLDYPARIVSTSKDGCRKNLMEIVASPKDSMKNGQNAETSLDEEKMTKMISFANLLAEKSNEKEASAKKLKRKRLLKKRTDIVQDQDKGSKGNSSTDNEHEIEKSAKKRLKENVNEEQTLSQDIEPKQTKKRCDILEDSQNVISIVEKNQREEKVKDRNKDRNMFDELEELVSKQNSMSESCNESVASYDSSDLETYEKFVSNRKVSDVKKPKSQFIESYYINKSMEEQRNKKIESGNSITGSSFNFKTTCSRKEMDFETPSRNSSKEKEMEILDSNSQNQLLQAKPRTSLYSKSSSDIDEIRQEVGQFEVQGSSGSDIAALPSKTDITRSLSEINQKSITVCGKQVKKLIKTKFIILKGDICDRWFDIKRKTGFGEMSDPKFIHYLLRSEDEKQTKKEKLNEVSVQTDMSSNPKKDQSNCTDTSFDYSKVDPETVNYDINLNSNNNADSFLHDKTTVSDEDFEATIVNVTDTPLSSPMLSDVSSPGCETNIQSSTYLKETTSMISSPEHPFEIIDNAFGKGKQLPDGPDHCSKRNGNVRENNEKPAAKKQYPILSCATQRQMQWAVSLFREWLRETGDENTQFECMDSAWLNNKLAKFYTDALSHEGTPYSTNILQTFRRALSLYLTSSCSSQNVCISISQDKEYTRSNEILTELVFTETLQNNVTGRDNVSFPITEDDMKKLYTTRTLSDDDPTCLMWKVWFDITYHLCKGNLPKNFWRSLTKRSLVLESDVNGVYYSFADYVYIPPDEEPGKMYATPTEPEKCPVRSTSFYLSKLCANCEALFQCSKRSWHKQQERWYLPVPMSREKLDKVMCRISEQAQLSMVYDSSCVILTAKLKGEPNQ